MQRGDKLRKARKRKILTFLSVVSSFICIFSFLIWTPIFLRGKLNELALFAAGSVFPKSTLTEESHANYLKNTTDDNIFIPSVITFGGEEIKKNVDLKGLEDIDALIQSVPKFELSHKDGEGTYKIVECLFGASGDKFENIYVNNKTNVNLNIASVLSQNPDISVNKSALPQVSENSPP